MDKTAATEAFWAEFKIAARLDHDDYAVAAFGDSVEMMDKLAALVETGLKRATTSALRDYEGGREKMPAVGDYIVLVDGKGFPRLVWRTVQVDVSPLNRVDAAFAWDEGEGDRSLADWFDSHRRYFVRQAAREGFAMRDDIECVLERFEVLWPPALADRR
jgi:uncharacterized protein YhfF